MMWKAEYSEQNINEMFKETDAVVVGCGLTGSVIARHLADSGKRVLVLERRDHIDGNMFDYIDKHGFLVQKYGPHAFHATKKELFDFMCRYEEWDTYRLTLERTLRICRNL